MIGLALRCVKTQSKVIEVGQNGESAQTLPTPSDRDPPASLVLASSSRYRRELLERFGLPFAVDSPAVDEAPAPQESAAALVRRLSEAKARAVAERWPQAVVIGSDQAASFEGRILGKPGTVAKAVAQLLEFAGKRVDFYTGVAVLHAPSGRIAMHLDRTTAHFRQLRVQEVERYVHGDQPLDCAGGIKFEGLGPLLLTAVDTRDPSASIGLPLIELGAMLRAEGINPLA